MNDKSITFGGPGLYSPVGPRRLFVKSLLAVAFFVLAITVALMACGQAEKASLFSVELLPAQVDDAIPGQRCVFLVRITAEEEGVGKGEAVSIFASCSGAIVTVTPESIAPGKVAEVTVIPDEDSAGETLTVIALGERDGIAVPAASIFQVKEGVDIIAGTAVKMRDHFVSWLAENQPELGITSATGWEGTIVKPDATAVNYYLFFSADWEMGISWHAALPPENWARIYLRERVSEANPSYAFEIESWSSPGEPCAIDPPESVWR